MLELLQNFDLATFLKEIPILFLYLFTFLYMTINGSINFPSSQIFYITLGYSYHYLSYNIPLMILVGSLGNAAGNYIFYALISTNNSSIYKIVEKYSKINPETVEVWSNKIKSNSSAWLIVAKQIPSVKVLVPLIAGMLKIAKLKALIIFFVGSLIWCTALIYIGVFFGDNISLTNFFLALTVIYIAAGYFFSKRAK